MELRCFSARASDMRAAWRLRCCLAAGELFIHRERVRHAAALLQIIAEEYFRERPSLTRDLVWAVSEFEELEHCEVAGAAVFVAFVGTREG
jgi:hypothetical protein